MLGCGVTCYLLSSVILLCSQAPRRKACSAHICKVYTMQLCNAQCQLAHVPYAHHTAARSTASFEPHPPTLCPCADGSGHNPVGLTPLGVEALLVHPTLERVQLLGCCGLRYDNEMAALEHHAAGMAGMELTVEYADEPPSPIPSPSPSPSRSLSPPY